MTRTRPGPSHPRPWALAGLAAAALAAASLAACNQPLFSERNPRTQYDRYDRARGQFAPAYLEDEYGRKEPNLKGRLDPK